MTPDQRKRLGLNKSTLWHMRKTSQIARLGKFTVSFIQTKCNLDIY